MFLSTLIKPHAVSWHWVPKSIPVLRQGDWPPPHLSERPFRPLPSGSLPEFPWLWPCPATVPWSVPAFLLDKTSVGPRSFGEVGGSPLPEHTNSTENRAITPRELMAVRR